MFKEHVILIQGRSNHICTYARKKFIYLFIYLFDLFIYLLIYFFGEKPEKRLIHMQEFSLIITAKRKLCAYYTIHFNMRARAQSPAITTVMVETLVSTCAAKFPVGRKARKFIPGTRSEHFFSYLQHAW